MSCRELSSDDPRILAWLDRFVPQVPHFSHALDYSSGSWLGLFVNERLLSAFGYTYCKNDVVCIEYALCEPSKAGRIGLDALMRTLRQTFSDKTLRFHCEISNLKIRRMVEALGAKPVAYLYELGPEEHHG